MWVHPIDWRTGVCVGVLALLRAVRTVNLPHQLPAGRDRPEPACVSYLGSESSRHSTILSSLTTKNPETEKVVRLPPSFG